MSDPHNAVGGSHRTTIQMSQRLYRLITERAKAEGISVGQFLREAALARLVYLWATDNPGEVRSMEEGLREIRAELF